MIYEILSVFVFSLSFFILNPHLAFANTFLLLVIHKSISLMKMRTVEEEKKYRFVRICIEKKMKIGPSSNYSM